MSFKLSNPLSAVCSLPPPSAAQRPELPAIRIPFRAKQQSMRLSCGETKGNQLQQHKHIPLWMDEILHHSETMGHHCLLVFSGESSFQGFLDGAGFRPSTVSHCPTLAGISLLASSRALAHYLHCALSTSGPSYHQWARATCGASPHRWAHARETPHRWARCRCGA